MKKYLVQVIAHNGGRITEAHTATVADPDGDMSSMDIIAAAKLRSLDWTMSPGIPIEVRLTELP